MPRAPDLRPNAVDYIAPTLRYGQAMHDGQPPLPSLRREVRTSVRSEPAAGMFALAALGLMFASTGATLLMRANSAPRFTDRGSVGTWCKATSVQPAAVVLPIDTLRSQVLAASGARAPTEPKTPGPVKVTP